MASLDVQHEQTVSGPLDASTGTQGERWRCGGLEGTAGPEAEDGEHGGPRRASPDAGDGRTALESQTLMTIVACPPSNAQ